MEAITLNTHQSIYREHLIGHLLIGELLKHSRLHDQASLEISKPELDRAGHDIILESNGITRHVQLKSLARTPVCCASLLKALQIGPAGQNPAGKVGWHWRFQPDTLVGWIVGKNCPVELNIE